MQRVVVFSDTHFGEEECLLNNKDINLKLINELKNLGTIDTIVLLGDILDLSLATWQEALKMVNIFFQSFIDNNLDIKEIIYVPGNHDHHFWVLQVEHKEIIEKIKQGNLPQLADYVKEYKNDEVFITQLLPKQLRQIFTVAYPNYILNINGKEFLFHHGHYLSIEGGLICGIKEALDERISLNEFELQNAVIHEVIQYFLERSVFMHKKIETAWETAGVPASILAVIDEMLDGRGLAGWLIRRLYKWSYRWRKYSMRGKWLDKWLISRIKDYLKLTQAKERTNFVFGHTHVPQVIKENDFYIINSGSWVATAKEAKTYVIIDDGIKLKKLEGEFI